MCHSKGQNLGLSTYPLVHPSSKVIVTFEVNNTTLILSWIFCSISGNKIDQINRREIPEHIGKQFAKRYEMKFIETSAKEADNVDTLFLDIAMELTKLARQQALESDKSPNFSASNTTVVSSCSSCFRFWSSLLS